MSSVEIPPNKESKIGSPMSLILKIGETSKVTRRSWEEAKVSAKNKGSDAPLTWSTTPWTDDVAKLFHSLTLRQGIVLTFPLYQAGGWCYCRSIAEFFGVGRWNESDISGHDSSCAQQLQERGGGWSWVTWVGHTSIYFNARYISYIIFLLFWNTQVYRKFANTETFPLPLPNHQSCWPNSLPLLNIEYVIPT